MQSAVLVDQETIEMRTRDQPEPGPGEVLVAVEDVGICGSDVHYYKHGRIGQFVVSYPLVLGHEMAGSVEEVGEGVSSSLRGQRVAVEPGIPCRRCFHCKRGEYHLCAEMQFMATPPTDGALTEYVTWPADLVYRLPRTVSTREAALCEPLSCGIHAVRTGAVDTGDSVLVTGDGPIGIFTMIAAERAGATTTIITGHHDEKLQTAAEAGADRIINTTEDDPEDIVTDVTDGQGVDVAIDCSGAESAVSGAIEATRRGGVVVLYGLAPELTVPVDVVEHTVGEIDLRGGFRYSNTYPSAVEIIQEVDVEQLIQFEEPLVRTERAFERVANSDVIKGLISVE